MMTLTFSTDNAAFDDAPATEVCAILRDIAAHIENGELEGPIHDANGNRIGQFSLDGR